MELELKSEKENAEIRIESVEDYQSIVDAEWDIIYDKLDKIVASGATVGVHIACGETLFQLSRWQFCRSLLLETWPHNTLLTAKFSVLGELQTTT